MRNPQFHRDSDQPSKLFRLKHSFDHRERYSVGLYRSREREKLDDMQSINTVKASYGAL